MLLQPSGERAGSAGGVRAAHALKAEPTGGAGRLGVRCERRRVRKDLKEKPKCEMVHRVASQC